MTTWRQKEEDKRISKVVVHEKTTPQLRSALKFIKGLLTLKKSDKLYKTYVKGTKNAIEYNGENKVYLDFRFDGTTTGRLSCASYKAKKAMGVSFHTLPREEETNIREIFVAPPESEEVPEGWDFIAADYKAMELRVLCHIAKERKMQKAFIDGVDLHTYTASLLFKKEMSKVTKMERQISKSVSFLIVYGGGAFNLAETMGISMKRAEKIIKTYQEVYPGIFSYMEHVNKFVLDNEYAYTIFGRKRHLLNVRSREMKVVNRTLRQGLNFTIQSPASDIILCALLGIQREFKKRKMKARAVATVHDSVEIVCPKSETKLALAIIHYHMTQYPLLKEVFGYVFDIPFGVDVEVGSSFGNGEAVEFKDNGEPIWEELIA